MNIYELQTPSFLVDMDILENNIRKVQDMCNNYNKELWPMTKTHKSTEIAKMQLECGAKGLLVGTIDEAECFIGAGVKEVALPYPISDIKNINRVISLSDKANVIPGFDGIEVASIWNNELIKQNKRMECFIIIDSGLGRLGVDSKESLLLADEINKLSNLEIVGISTHPGHVYGVKHLDEIDEIAEQEISVMKDAKEILEGGGYKLKYVATGSTPTMNRASESGVFNMIRPGNYVFYDNIQISLGVCKEEDCAMTVLASVISKPKDNLFIIDAGSKCLGLDKGAHGSNLIKGFGRVLKHEELEIVGLSEEVGKVSIKGETNLKVGDKIQIIPNHSCSSCNMTDHLIGYRNNEVEKIIEIDVRGNSSKVLI